MLHCLFGPLLIGGVAGSVAGDRTGRRPIVRAIVKGGVAAGRKLESVSAAVLMETRKLVEEARAELDRPGGEGSK